MYENATAADDNDDRARPESTNITIHSTQNMNIRFVCIKKRKKKHAARLILATPFVRMICRICTLYIRYMNMLIDVSSISTFCSGFVVAEFVVLEVD